LDFFIFETFGNHVKFAEYSRGPHSENTAPRLRLRRVAGYKPKPRRCATLEGTLQQNAMLGGSS
jgi:hypothetical protein